MASRGAAGLLAVGAFTLVTATAAGAAPLVPVKARLVRIGARAFVTGQVDWDGEAARRAPDYMSVGDLRLVAVSDHGHRPTLLATATYDQIASHPTQQVFLPIARNNLPAIRRGNRVVLTASQHGVESPGSPLTDRTYVTVAQLQPFGSKQDRIGRLDCSSLPIVPGAELDKCDLVGAYLNGAQVSVRKPGTRMRLADLTGATMVGADLTGLSVAGGRLNGADVTDAVLNNLSLAGAEATGLIARGARSGVDSAGASMFDTRLTDADFRGAVLNGVLLEHARLDGADFRGATWTAIKAPTASFRGADLEGLKEPSTGAHTGWDVYFADFTDANLQGTPFSPADLQSQRLLQWTTLCHTLMPGGFDPGSGNRDCRVPRDPGPPPAADPFVVVRGKLTVQEGRAEIHAKISWNAQGITRFGMSEGDIRVVAIDGTTGLPTLIASLPIEDLRQETETSYAVTIIGHDKLAALHRGNRVVLTATQHPPLPESPIERTKRSYVTVDTLQPGPERGRVGSRDCSDIPLTPTPPAPDGYDLCDLPGAVLTQADLSAPDQPMHEADLTGAKLDLAGLKGIVFDGSAMGGADLTGAQFNKVHMIDVLAPRLTMPGTTISDSQLMESGLDGADFHEARLTGETTDFAAASLRGATFTDATFESVDLSFARLPKAKLDGVKARPPRRQDQRSTLFLANLTAATLEGSEWEKDEAGEEPWRWATLCDTIMPAGVNVSGDRDCPR